MEGSFVFALELSSNSREESELKKNQFDMGRTEAFCISDSRLKMPVFLILFIAPVLLHQIRSLALIFALLLVTFYASSIRISVFFTFLKRVFLLVVFVVALNLIMGSGEDMGRFSLRDLQSGLVAAFKVINLYFAAAIFIVTTSQEDLAQGTALILRPFSTALARKVALYGFIVMGFMPIFAEEARRIQIVQRFRRGGNANNLMAKIQSAPTVIVPLIISALHRSSQLASVVELRGVESKLPHLLPTDKPGPADYVWLAAVPLVIALSLLIQSV